jgi:hypothetical protein
MFSDKNVDETLNSFAPKIDGWIKGLFDSFEELNLTRPQKEMIQATNKKFNVDFCTVAHWENGKIIEENLFYDLVGMMNQLGFCQPNYSPLE